ncbi:hypothetical protein [Bacillus thuringiensis]|nr:hypothetical protein [Bacillus thuringiensis]
MQESSATLLVAVVGLIAFAIYMTVFPDGVTTAVQTMMSTFHR